MFLSLFFFILTPFIVVSSTPYIDKGYPYLDGRLPTDIFEITKSKYKSPLHCVASYPKTAGTYGVYFFIGGLDSLVDAEAYTNYLSRISGHGFVTVGVDLAFPAEARKKPNVLKVLNYGDFADDFIKQYHWLEENLNGIISNRSAGVFVDWNYSAIGSHSAGADGALLMTERNNTIAKSIVYYEPFSFKFLNRTDFSMPALVIGTKYSEEKKGKFPPCIIPGFGFEHFYDYWGHSKKILIEAKNFGHCDVLDLDIRLVCDKFNICLTGNTTNIDLYHDFAQGVTSAFLVYSLYGYNGNLQFLTQTENMPIEIEQLKYNLTSFT